MPLKNVALALTLTVLGFLAPAQAETIKVGATAGPHAEVLEAAAKVAARNGLDVRIIEFNDYIMPDAALAAGDLDANSYQHLPFLESQIAARGYKLVPVGRTVLFPIAVYSKKYKRLEDLPRGAQITIPNDPANEARTLLLFQSVGLIRLRDGVGFKATPLDIIENPHGFRFRSIEAAQLARSLDDVHASAVNANYALLAGLNPQRDSILLEKPQSQYVCEIVVRAEDKDKPWVRRLVAAYQSDEVKDFINTRYPGAGFAGW
ncbi:D-methionine-binding lipoprotein MetQ [Rhodovastum atsumiense]|uniref:MetQ/NlpA family ABC transporter substrate-binding protein n=1 Tax=Rhodovastum atsumiense TaxID=504468 RepID=A0A5M6IWQ4_9PROT|nr:MetQ/NlpA family ABC transporter substrate-binding protein [Rhodovastum atsumiense]KAA5612277.1 MetQ/NlpA family ABC transporter substrate-binding protein [Rhodovastum atsumiense]CAH2601603.1 D-methionine-binding lipoprotein MetQ [Rhodovastum atsumiense]